MKKRMLIFTIGLMLGLAVTGCGNNENAESSLESLIESTVEESTEVETETDNKRMTPPYTTAPLPGEDGCGLRKPPEVMSEEAEKEAIFITQPTDREDDVLSYETTEEENSEELFIPKPEIIKADENEWVDDCELSELPETPYNEKLDEYIKDRLETGYGFGWEWYPGYKQDTKYHYKWIDCGMYYKVKNVDIEYFYDSEFGGLDYDIIGHFDELYILKEGEYIFNGVAYTNIDEWLEESLYSAPRFGLIFDEKGYIIGWHDAGVS